MLTQEEKTLFTQNISEGHEIEVRFGSFKAYKFTPEVSKEQFMRTFNFLLGNKKFYNHDQKEQKIENYKNTRKITEDGKISFSQKKKISNIDNKEWGFRIAVSSESDTKPEKFTPDLVRSRTRHTFTNVKNNTRFDLDIFKEEDDIVYTVELECLKNCSIQQFENDIHLTLQILQKAQIISPMSVKADVLKHYFNIVKKNKFAGIQPMTLNDDKFDKKSVYALTKKLDGMRYNLICFNKNLYQVSNKLEITRVPYTCESPEMKDSILDVEYYKSYYHIFDLVDLDTKSSKNLKCRLDYIHKTILPIVKTVHENVPKLVIKEYFFSNNLKELYNIFTNTTKTLDSTVYDGLILVKMNENYMKSSPLKWKPVEMNTIDFYILKKPDLLFEMYVGDGDKENGLALFTSSVVSKKDYDLYSNKDIVEFSYKNNSWVPLKLRDDKDKPNYKTVAEDNLHSVTSPFNPENTFKENVLFNMRRFHNYVKRRYIDTYKGKSVLDLASGQGGDFGKYIDSSFTRIDAFDINKKSINEATSRAMKITKHHGQNTVINIKQSDLSKEVVEPIGVKFDLVVTNFAFHYFYKNMPTYISSVKNNIKKGGHLLVTLFDGKLVKDIKSENYEIKVSGDEITVRIKDSILDKPEKESIVNIDIVVDYFKKNGLVLVENVNFKDIYPEWKKIGRNSMSKEEKDLSFMNIVLVFKAT